MGRVLFRDPVMPPWLLWRGKYALMRILLLSRLWCSPAFSLRTWSTSKHLGGPTFLCYHSFYEASIRDNTEKEAAWTASDWEGRTSRRANTSSSARRLGRLDRSAVGQTFPSRGRSQTARLRTRTIIGSKQASSSKGVRDSCSHGGSSCRQVGASRRTRSPQASSD